MIRRGTFITRNDRLLFHWRCNLLASTTRQLNVSAVAATCRPVRGMRDRFMPDTLKYRHITEHGRAIAEAHGFVEVTTPILEYAEVFEGSLGTSSDVIGKELYKFTDKSGSEVIMRPEGTAGIVRALISNRQLQSKSQRLFYHGPMFRHERPQKGRLRQFEQFGVELFGQSHPTSDVELIRMGWSFIERLGLPDTPHLEINSLGDIMERLEYIEKLCEYFYKRKESLSSDSQRRLTENPLRIFDSKAPEDQPLIEEAPRLIDHLTPESRRRFAFVCELLEAVNVPYTVNSRLVRGLDYYNDTVWEVKYSEGTSLGASQDTILAGGRYDTLVATLSDDTSVPAVGWAAGIDRLALLLPESIKEKENNLMAIAVMGLPVRGSPEDLNSIEGATNLSIYKIAYQVADRVRNTGYQCSLLHQTSQKSARMGRALSQASEMNMKNTLTVRDLRSREQVECTLDGLPEVLSRLLASK
ncbi:hypothetical protein BDF19DRAFT_453972 [Syncephalis fuscata]|nr:hypothetical protein BDF19DRAFT_453972 [Syncephalis fuscata]